jgi:hypothetical protein
MQQVDSWDLHALKAVGRAPPTAAVADAFRAPVDFTALAGYPSASHARFWWAIRMRGLMCGRGAVFAGKAAVLR